MYALRSSALYLLGLLQRSCGESTSARSGKGNGGWYLAGTSKSLACYLTLVIRASAPVSSATAVVDVTTACRDAYTAYDRDREIWCLKRTMIRTYVEIEYRIIIGRHEKVCRLNE